MIQRRLATWQAPEPKCTQGNRAPWVDQVLRAPDACGFRFCVEEDWLLGRRTGRERQGG